MRIGFTISDFEGKRPGELLALARSFGVEFVELNPTVLNDLPSVRENISGIAAGFHLPLVSEHGFDFSTLEAKEKIDDTIHLLNHHRYDLNLIYCVTHPPEAEVEDSEADIALEFLIENLKRLEIPLIIENVETWSESEFDRLYQHLEPELEKKLLGFCYDPAHSFLRGEDIFKRFDAIADKVLCIHLSDCLQDQDAHLPLGRGNLPVDKFLRHVAEHSFDGVINLEIAPESLEDGRALVDSYLRVLRVFKLGKYLTTNIRFALKSMNLSNLAT